MMKRILSFALALLMVVSMIPVQTFATDADGVTELAATEAPATEPSATEPKATEPKATEPKATEPEVTEPKATEPKATEPEVTEPEVTEPKATEPEVTEPEATEPEVTEPKVTEPEATEPEVTEPEATEPEVTEPEVTEPVDNCAYCEDTLAEDGAVLHAADCNTRYAYNGAAQVDGYAKLSAAAGAHGVTVTADPNSENYVNFRAEEFGAGTVLRITGWHWDVETSALWYRVALYAGAFPAGDETRQFPTTVWILDRYTNPAVDYGATLTLLEKCTACGAPDCTAQHTHCQICSAYDCTAEHKQCEVCTAYDCTAEHKFCDLCQKYDCGIDHGAELPRIPMTSAGPSAAILGSSGTGITSPDSAYAGNIGKRASFNPMYTTQPIFYTADPTALEDWFAADTITGTVEMESLVVIIRDVYDDGSVYWYKIEAAEGHTLPADMQQKLWIFQNFVGEDATYDTLLLQTVPACPICGTPGCTTEHVQCDKCGNYDCKAVHFWCEHCRKYNCGVTHTFCPACGAVDCKAAHTFCPNCGKFDCGLEHEDLFAPITAPVIPENPQLSGDAVSIVDGDGNSVSGGLRLEDGVKSSISAWPAGGASSYQWQVCYNRGNDLWVDIQGATSKGLLVSPAMFLSIINYQGVAYVRCVATVGGETMTSAAIPVTVVEAMPPQEKMMMFAARPGAKSSAAPAADEGTEYSLVIEYKFRDGKQAASTWTASLKEGADYILDVKSPTVLGYKPDQARITEDIRNFSGHRKIIVYYDPDIVEFKVTHHQQNLTGNGYTAVQTETKKGVTGTEVGVNLQKSYPGFDQLRYDESLVVAADGSTVVHIYYDRMYFMLSLNLNGGYGPEPLYARYGTPVSLADPQRTGYTFTGWTPALPGSVVTDTTHTAGWTPAQAEYTVAFWYENANDTNYTFVGSTKKTGTTGQKVSGSIDDYNSATFTGKDSKNFNQLDEAKTDKEVPIEADGTTLVNVYIKRRTYTLAYYRWKCVHDHSSGCTYCSKVNHEHTPSCVTHGLTAASNTNQNTLNKNNEKFNGNEASAAWGTHYVYFNGTWYRKSGLGNEYDEIEWSCNGTGGKLDRHTHSASCCTHTASWGCACQYSSAGWYAAYGPAQVKYEANTTKIHQDMEALGGSSGGIRWVPGICEGFQGWNDDNRGDGTAVGAFTSMPSGDAIFYESGVGSKQFEITYWLEGADGGGSKTYGSYKFNKSSDSFQIRMGGVGWMDEFYHGTPLGFERYAATYGPDGNTDQYTLPQKDANGNQGFQSSYTQNNFYYIRKVFTLEYRNGTSVVATRSMRYEQPLTSAYELDGNAMDMDCPYGDGYEFGGWYLDNDCTVRATFNGSIKMPNAGNSSTTGLVLFARWVPVVHEVNTYLTKGGEKLNSYSIAHGEPYDVPVNDPANGLFNFVGWFYEMDGEEHAYDFSMPVYRNMELYAKWTSDTVVTGTITYLDRATGQPVAQETPIRGMLGATKTYDAKIGSELNVTGYFPETPSHNIEFSANTNNNNYIFYYNAMEEVAYEVRYLNAVSKQPMPGVESVTGTTREPTLSFKAVTIKGYSADAYEKTMVVSSDPSLNVVTFYYTEDDVHAPVQVVHYLQEPTGGDNYSRYLTEEPYQGIIGQAQERTPLTITGFTYNAAKSKNGIALTEDGLLLELYYDRLSFGYTFRFEDDKGNTLRNPVSDVALYGSQVEYRAPAVSGYRLTTTGSQTITITDNTVNADANVKTFVYTEAEVTITYRVAAGGGGSVNPTYEQVMAVNGGAQGSTAVVASDDYTFTGWYSDYSASDDKRLTTSVTFVPGKTDGVYEEATYYAKFDEVLVDLYYQVVMPDGAQVQATLSRTTEQVGIVSGRAKGSTVTIPEGYEFAGWYTDPACEGTPMDTRETLVPTRLDRWVDGTTYYAKFVEQQAVIIYTVVGDGTVCVNGTEDHTAEDVGMLTGTAVGATASPIVSADGIAISTFKGWYRDAACQQLLTEEASFTPTMPIGKWDETNIYYAKFERLPFTATFVDRGETVDTQTYRAGEALTLPTVTNGSYLLTWTVDPERSEGCWLDEEADLEELLAGGGYGDVTLVANWTINVVWMNWDFTVTGFQNSQILEIDRDVAYGAEHTYNGADPARDADAQYTYSFNDRWETIDLSEVPAEMTKGYVVYRAIMDETINEYTITWLNDDGALIDTTFVAYGTVPTHADPVKAATDEYIYTFAGWDPEVVAVTGPATYKATYTETPNRCTITWLNDDGTLIDTTSVTYGTVPTHADPVKPATAEFTYTFTGWTPEVVAVTGPATYKATYSAAKNRYTLSGTIDRGTVTDPVTVEYGELAAVTFTAANGYQIVSWNVNGGETQTMTDPKTTWTYTTEALLGTTEVAVQTAPAPYTITYVHNDGTDATSTAAYTIESTDVVLATPAARTGWNFKGWKVQESVGSWTKDAVLNAAHPVENQYGNVTLVAQWVRTFTVTWMNGTTVLETDTEVEAGTSAVYNGATPVSDKAGYTCTFAHWLNYTDTVILPGSEVSNVTKDLTIVARFDEVLLPFTITYDLAGGTLPENVASNLQPYDVETAVTLMAAPSREGWKFTGWYLANSLASPNGNWSAGTYQASEARVKGYYGNVTLVAQWQAQYRYELSFDSAGGTAVETRSQPWCDTATHTFTWNNTTAPTRPGYTLTGWVDEEGNAVTRSAEGTYSYTMTGTATETVTRTLTAVWERDKGDLVLDYSGDGAPVIVTITCTGSDADNGVELITIETVITADTTITGLPTGTYTVTAEPGRGNYTASAEPGTVTVPAGDFAEVDVSTAAKNNTWLTGFARWINRCS